MDDLAPHWRKFLQNLLFYIITVSYRFLDRRHHPTCPATQRTTTRYCVAARCEKGSQSDDLAARLATEEDDEIRNQLQRTLENR